MVGHQLTSADHIANGSGKVAEVDMDSIPSVEDEIARLKARISSLEASIAEDVAKEDANGNASGVDPNLDIAPEDLSSYHAPEWCVPIRADVRAFNWKSLANAQQFDAIVMDPPWQLAGAAPTRGVALGYAQLPNNDISNIPIPTLQTNGLLFIWVINARYAWAIEQMESWGYKIVDDIAWVKRTVNRRFAKGHGYYLQHGKETCLVGLKGELPAHFKGNVGSDVIFAERRGQSQKPEELYQLIEELVPNGKFLEIFARKNNLRDYWVSVGNEL